MSRARPRLLRRSNPYVISGGVARALEENNVEGVVYRFYYFGFVSPVFTPRLLRGRDLLTLLSFQRLHVNRLVQFIFRNAYYPIIGLIQVFLYGRSPGEERRIQLKRLILLLFQENFSLLVDEVSALVLAVLREHPVMLVRSLV